ncbi:nucleoside deaminase [Myxosarcina sp. GI1]|uniref:nucleoside deaminase n=1 Tax=Myxosarcina sp. GI1 TaxID=1541065 RepID=UPI0012E01AB4|nr:nucleoside deaminase [Myxosarcina sp. GI1]
MKHEDFMRIALEEAKKGDMPYGAVLVKDGEIILQGHNTSQTDNDVLAHAESNVLRSFTKKNSYSLDALKGYTLYTTCEPCPMCAAACVWAGLSEIVFGASIKELIGIGSKQIDIACEEIVAKGFQNIKVTKGILAQECLELFK